ncbi:thiosulfate/3-mercaptopyruvate sulfurtransferase [Microcella alkaliphila]|uniref:Thiosulfate/3-mercaptopyruvate sulfurtransferase n=1 Tax=Microcella alkaliphila TaxID=279828 RepID=A0A4Q7THV0_9MICO|nr:sulfurtransferase [Microcella alkaliphila]RZT59507.1 thiosulfate/3-mercaptopyruvate sulfurtransferase [Microcella alkaliphila]
MLPPIVSPSWFAEHRDEVVVADVRWYLDGRSGREAHEAGHIPGAVFVDLDAWLAAPATPADGRHPLPDPAVFAMGLGAVGIGDGDAVVAYDDAGGVIAARLVWMLRAVGHDAALLDGGLDAWVTAHGEDALETGPVDARPRSLSTRAWPAERLADLDEVSRASADEGPLLVDARAPERYRGEEEPVDARAGHIPGAVNLPTRDHVGPDGLHLAPEVLRERFAAAGAAEREVVAYCGSGVTACHTLIALEYAGLSAGRLYPGSWSQYAAAPGLPVATAQ